jgi:hypothetical protein
MEKTDKARCEVTRQMCNPARSDFCKCWLESEDQENFRHIALRRINQASKKQLGIKE